MRSGTRVSPGPKRPGRPRAAGSRGSPAGAASSQEAQKGRGRGGQYDHDQKRRAKNHRDDRDRQRGRAHVEHEVLTGGEGLRRDKGRERVGGEGADERPCVPEDEKHDSRRPEREASREWVVARDGHRGRLVDHELRGERPAPAANGEERGKPQAVERVARSEQARRQRAGPYAPSRADNPDERELRSAREHEQRQRASLYEGEARGGRYRAEGDRIGAARERDAKGIAKDPPPGISRSSFRRARRRSIARRSC